MTKVRPTTAEGKRRMTPEARAKLSATNKAKYAAMTPEQQAAITARLKRTPAKNVQSGDKSMLAEAARRGQPPPAGGRVNPLAMTPLELLRSLRGRTSSGDPAKQ